MPLSIQHQSNNGDPSTATHRSGCQFSFVPFPGIKQMYAPRMSNAANRGRASRTEARIIAPLSLSSFPASAHPPSTGRWSYPHMIEPEEHRQRTGDGQRAKLRQRRQGHRKEPVPLEPKHVSCTPCAHGNMTTRDEITGVCCHPPSLYHRGRALATMSSGGAVKSTELPFLRHRYDCLHHAIRRTVNHVGSQRVCRVVASEQQRCSR